MKKNKRIKKSIKIKNRIKKTNKFVLKIHKTIQHIYITLFTKKYKKIITQCSSLEKKNRNKLKHTGNIKSSILVGKNMYEKLKELNILNNIAFDRSGFKYHGRIKALADSIRQNGKIKF